MSSLSSTTRRRTFGWSAMNPRAQGGKVPNFKPMAAGSRNIRPVCWNLEERHLVRVRRRSPELLRIERPVALGRVEADALAGFLEALAEELGELALPHHAAAVVGVVVAAAAHDVHPAHH